MKKLLLSIALLLSCNLWAEAQSNDVQKIGPRLSASFEYEDECGSPSVESSLWMSIEGTVIKVLDGNSIVVLTKDNKRRQVDLVALDTSVSADAARRRLTELVLNQQVEVLVSTSNIDSKKVSGVVHVPGADVNRELIKAGLARYKKPKSYSMSNYTACVYRIIEREAREAKRGLWGRIYSR